MQTINQLKNETVGTNTKCFSTRSIKLMHIISIKSPKLFTQSTHQYKMSSCKVRWHPDKNNENSHIEFPRKLHKTSNSTLNRIRTAND